MDNLPKPVLEAIGLTKSFNGEKALDDLHLKVGEGEIVCLLGANGAGKTTTINLFLGFLKPCSGEAKVLGLSVRDELNKTRALLGYVAEIVALYPSLTGRENFNFFHSLSGAAPLDEFELSELLSKLDFPLDALNKPVAQYSKGMRQKIGLAIAIAKKAKAILLDEPLSGLDPKAANDLVHVLKAVSAGGVALLISSHDIFRAKQLANRVVIMAAGRLKAEIEISSMSASELEELYLKHIAATY